MKKPALTKNQETALRRLDRFVDTLILIGILSFTLLVCCSCGSTKVVTQTVERVSKDTVYLSNIQYDSIFVSQDRMIDRSRDTLYIKEASVEYRYKLLRDTVRVIQCDSIPYEITIVETKEIERPLTLFDKICRWAFTFLLFLVLLYGVRFIRKFP